jgi:hypothetical protein
LKFSIKEVTDKNRDEKSINHLLAMMSASTVYGQKQQVAVYVTGGKTDEQI